MLYQDRYGAVVCCDSLRQELKEVYDKVAKKAAKIYQDGGAQFDEKEFIQGRKNLAAFGLQKDKVRVFALDVLMHSGRQLSCDFNDAMTLGLSEMLE